MEQSQKRKISVNICGTELSLMTDEPEAFVDSVTEQLNERIETLTKNNFRISHNDAAILCAIDYLCDKLKAERRIKNLEAQLLIYEMNIKKIRAELESQRAPSAAESDAKTSAEAATAEAASLIMGDGDGKNTSTEDKIKALEDYLEKRRSSPSTKQSREEKIKYIESLLRGTNGGADKSETSSKTE